MLKTKQKLGQAIKTAIDLKLKSGAVRSKTEIAEHFGVRLPSIYDWIRTGSISKDKLFEMFDYFADVVEISHWVEGNADSQKAAEFTRLSINEDAAAYQAEMERLSQFEHELIVKTRNIPPHLLGVLESVADALQRENIDTRHKALTSRFPELKDQNSARKNPA